MGPSASVSAAGAAELAAAAGDGFYDGAAPRPVPAAAPPWNLWPQQPADAGGGGAAFGPIVRTDPAEQLGDYDTRTPLERWRDAFARQPARAPMLARRAPVAPAPAPPAVRWALGASVLGAAARSRRR